MNLDVKINEKDLYKQTFQQAFIGMTLTNEEGNFLEVNETFCNMLGYSKEQLKKLSFQDVTHPDDLPKDLMLHSKIKNYEISTYQIEKRYHCKDGDIVWTSTNVSRVRGSHVIIAQILDITKQKQKEELYSEKEASYHLMAEYSTDLIMRHYPNGKAFSVSPSAREITGYDPQELIGSSPLDQTFIHPDDLPRTIESHKQIRFLKSTSKIRYRVRRKNGDYIWIESTAKGIFNKKTNQLEEIVTVSRDCTDQVQYDTELKKAKEKLEQSNDLINNIFESITDGFLALDYNGNIIFLNRKAKQILKNKHEVIGERAWRQFPFLQEPRFEKTFFKTINKQVPCQYEMYLEESNVWFEIRLYPRKEIVTIYFTDITQRKKNEEFLHKADKLNVVGQLAAGVAHEIRNPLTAIKGFIQLFQSNREYNEVYFDIINTEFKRVETIIYEFLTLAKPHHESNYREEDIYKIVTEVMTLENANAIMKNIELNLKCDENDKSTLVYCDNNSLKQVFINIIQNAIEATNTSGKIDIIIKDKHDFIEISCQDYGCGIPKNLIHRIGEPFYSLKEKGTGLGLMTCFKIIENHNGTILIDSEEGKGTTVSVRLPMDNR